MRKRQLLGGVVLLLSAGVFNPGFAEFGVGLGDVEKPSSDASARFNEGLSSFHLMLAELDRKNGELAAKQQSAAVQKIQEAANVYETAIKGADGHILKPKPQTEQEQADIAYFTAHAENYGLKQPVSQRDLVGAISSVVRKFGVRIKSEDLMVLARDLRRKQALSNYATDLQAFLVSTTTMLTLG